MANTRLRRAFRYPTDEDNKPEAIDEEEQEQLIAALRKENDENNQRWKRTTLLLPLLSSLFFVPAFFIAGNGHARLLCLMSLSSLAASAKLFTLNDHEKPTGLGQNPLVADPQSSPLRQYLPYLNGALCFVIALDGYLWDGSTEVHEGFWLVCSLPAIIFIATVGIRKILAQVDISELEKSKYEYKGA